MPVVTLSIFAGVGAQLFDNNGDPLSGGLLYTYEAGTTTPLTTYTSSTGTTAHTNPIVLDAAGKVPVGGEIWLDYTKKYKIIVKTSTNVQLNSYDNIGGSFNASPIVNNFVGDGVTTAYNLGANPTSENTTDIFINGVYQQKNTYSVSGSTVTFSQAPPYTSTIEVNFI